ncbi:permease for cytosine/purines, uracil, thiamine, allantoin-domain-containing protein [Armillaria borealis]|uniref:Permease for cytosine/purines, uracil, thiamine, allantoin-domain-containing protein n=1 Tax=Armillaria borealis TaxID=47425 RepID=A0AA39JP81_9AGAR|nr:permease for cytosine/purines, uracil, thiamine, allantoin-domain-containing protein [Armillaria borealis]
MTLTGKIIHLVETPGSKAFRGRHQWSNEDLDPTRTWRWYDYVSLWWGSSFNANGWASGSSLISLGLSLEHAIGVAAIGSAISSTAIVFASHPGSVFHLGYPVYIRSSMGVYAGYFFVALRSLIAAIYYGIQSYYAGCLLSVCFRCIFGYKWTTKMNPFSESANISVQVFTAFMIYYMITVPLLFVHPRAIKLAFEIKAVLLPPCAIGLCAWSIYSAGGLSQFTLATETKVSEDSCDTFLLIVMITDRLFLFLRVGWAWMQGINVVMSGISPMLISQPDLTRYARAPFDASYPQAIAAFLVKVLIYFGEPTWNMWDQLDLILDHNWNASARTLCFLVAITFVGGTALTNISANSIPFGADITAIFPRWFNIRRGQVLCAILGLAITPWNFLTNAAQFLTFLGSYNIFMGSLMGVMWCDYFVVRKENFHVPSLYTSDRSAPYWYGFFGINWRGIFAWICGAFIPFPGLIGSYDQNLVDKSVIRMFNNGWIISVAISMTVYWAASTLTPYFGRFPVPVYPLEYAHIPVTRGYLGRQSPSGAFPDEIWTPPYAREMSNHGIVDADKLSEARGDDGNLGENP